MEYLWGLWSPKNISENLQTLVGPAGETWSYKYVQWFLDHRSSPNWQCHCYSCLQAWQFGLFCLETFFFLFPFIFLDICYLLILSWFIAAAQSAARCCYVLWHPSWLLWDLMLSKMSAVSIQWTKVQLERKSSTICCTKCQYISDRDQMWSHMGEYLTEWGLSSPKQKSVREKKATFKQIMSNIKDNNIR